MKLLRTEYEVSGNRSVVWLFCRDNGVRTITHDSTLRPYFYVPEGEVLPDNRATEYEDGYRSIYQDRLSRVYVKLPHDVADLRNLASVSYEADVIFPTRYLIDKVDTLDETTPRVMFIDIEVESFKLVPNPERAAEQVLCISAYDSLTDSYSVFVHRDDLVPGQLSDFYDGRIREINYYRAERDMLLGFIGYFAKLGPDVVSGWNSNRFDMVYLINRIDNMGLNAGDLSPMGSAYIRGTDPMIKGCALVDLYDAYRRFTPNTEESYQLDYIARKVTGEGKIGTGEGIKWLWKNKLNDLISYNCNDVRITRMIDAKLSLLNFMDELRRLAFCQLEDTVVSTRISDSYILRKFHDRLVFPTKTHHEKTTIEGAFVGSWASGIYNNVVVFDLKSLYPSIIVSGNLSPEVIDIEAIDGININGRVIASEPKGFLPEIVESLFGERAKYKKLMKTESVGSEKWKLYDSRQAAVKIILNSLYGQTAYPGSRIFDPRVAELTTFMGREINAWSRRVLGDMGYDVIYSDTDGMCVAMDADFSFQKAEMILSILNATYSDFAMQYNIKHHIFSMEFDKVYRKAFFGKVKKRYCFVDCKSNIVWASRGVSKPIGQVKIGDKLLAWHNEKGVVETEVKEILTRSVDEYAVIKFDNSRCLRVTFDHPLFKIGAGWVSVDKLEVGDTLLKISEKDKMGHSACALGHWSKKRTKKLCPICGNMYSHLTNHVKYHHLGMAPSTNPVIAQKAASTYKLKKPDKICPTCGKECKNLNRHIWGKHIDGGKNIPKMFGKDNPMSDPKTVRKVLSGAAQKPNRFENAFIELFQRENLPITYTGSGLGCNIVSTDSGQICPDFTVTNKKKVIELFGYHWHKSGDDLKRKEQYEMAGYDCLVLWEPHGIKYGTYADQCLPKILEFLHNGSTITSIERIERRCKKQGWYKKNWEVINLRCEPYDNYFVNGILAHNCGHLIYKGGQTADMLEVVGFEVRRSDASRFSRNLQETIFRMLLKEDKNKDEVLRFVCNEIDRFRKGEIPLEDIGIPKGMTRGLEEYKHPAANIRGALYATNILKIELTNKPKMIYIKKMPEGLPETDVLCFDKGSQVPAGVQLDVEKMLTRLVKDKVDSIFEAMDWNIKDLQYHWKGKPKGKGEQLTMMLT